MELIKLYLCIIFIKLNKIAHEKIFQKSNNKIKEYPMKKVALVLIPLLIMAVTGLVSCNSCSSNKSSDQEKIEIEEKFSEEIPDVVYPLPTSADIIRMLTELEVGYMIGISNPVENAKHYVTSRSKAINMGVYGADLSYATLYNMNQDVINYLDAIRVLANDLNMAKIYNQRLYDDIKDSFDNRDRLVDILEDAFNGTYAYLHKNEQQSQALMVVAGAWVEGMYITTHISEATYHVNGIVEVLLEQKKSFEMFIDLAEPHKDDPNVKEILELFEPMRIIYQGIETSLSMTNVEDITLEIERLRDKITS
jgi:hypothetical protein